MINIDLLLKAEEYLNTVMREPSESVASIGAQFVLPKGDVPYPLREMQDQIEEFMKSEEKTKGFIALLFERMDEKGFEKNARFYRHAQVSKGTFSNLLKYGRCSPETLFRIIIALRLTEAEMIEMMAAAGQALDLRNKRDLLIKFCIRYRIYEPETVYDLLNWFGVKNIYPRIKNQKVEQEHTES